MPSKRKLRVGDKVLLLGLPYKVLNDCFLSMGPHDHDFFFTQLGLNRFGDQTTFVAKALGYEPIEDYGWNEGDMEAAQRLIDAINSAPVKVHADILDRPIGDGHDVMIYANYVTVGCNNIPFKDLDEIYQKMLKLQEAQAGKKPQQPQKKPTKRKPRAPRKRTFTKGGYWATKKAAKKRSRGRVKKKK